jgi:hypothetical protein
MERFDPDCVPGTAGGFKKLANVGPPQNCPVYRAGPMAHFGSRNPWGVTFYLHGVVDTAEVANRLDLHLKTGNFASNNEECDQELPFNLSLVGAILLATSSQTNNTMTLL